MASIDLNPQKTNLPHTKLPSQAQKRRSSPYPEGVDIAFGYPGGAIMPIIALYDYQDRLHHVLARHEQGSIHAAQVRPASGKVDVTRCYLRSRPPIITGIADADRIHPIGLHHRTSSVSSSWQRRFQETDVIGISIPVTNGTTKLPKPKRYPWPSPRPFILPALNVLGPY